MKLLILGGTRFVGRHIVEAALARRYDLTLFNRGTQSLVQWPGVEQRHGDRRRDLSALNEGHWDAVIDCCGYLPSEVQATSTLLLGRVQRYVFISSISAYASFASGNDEDAPLARLDALPDPHTEVVDAQSYGALKAGCESRVQACFGAAASLILRPGLVVGPGDPTGRFSYWPARVGQCQPGESVLVPAPAEAPVQWIDVRDLAQFTLDLLERRQVGVFNVASTPGRWCFSDLLQSCVRAAGLSAEPAWRWASGEWLPAQGVRAWMDLPLWLPAEAGWAGFMSNGDKAARAAGLQVRSLDETVRDTLAWWRSETRPPLGEQGAGLIASREQALLAALAEAGAAQ